MTEFEKMISGQMYDAKDAGLTDLRVKARALLDRINASVQTIDGGERRKLCQDLFGVVGDGFLLQPPFYCDYGINISWGRNVFINFNCVFLDVARITIGDHVQIGPNVQVYTATHPLDLQQRRAGKEYGKPITVGNDVWIGGGAVICPGVSIGEGAVIGAGTVVTKDVPAGVVVVGDPGRILGKGPGG